MGVFNFPKASLAKAQPAAEINVAECIFFPLYYYGVNVNNGCVNRCEVNVTRPQGVNTGV